MTAEQSARTPRRRSSAEINAMIRAALERDFDDPPAIRRAGAAELPDLAAELEQAEADEPEIEAIG